jgi:RimJ/RimL family protein N-acetyltransferase
MKLRKIIAEVMEGNANLMKLHALHGYREVGVYRDHIWKFGCFHDIHTYELLDDSWHGLRNKYGRYTAEFET